MKEQLLETLENSRNYTLAVAAAMPAEQYNFKPVDSVWSFRELADHIAYGIQWWEDNFVKGKKTEWAPPVVSASKEKVIHNLDKAYDGLKETITKKTLSETAVRGFYATLDHITHHRGQAVLYLRCNGIVPPEYTY